MGKNSFDSTNLERLSNYLRNQDFNGIRKFNLTSFVKRVRCEGEHICGTSACAIGFLPLAIPERVRYAVDFECYVTGLIIDSVITEFTSDVVCEFLGVNDNEYILLFTPTLGIPENYRYYPIKQLPCNATAVEVANNIDRFIRYRKSYMYKTFQILRLIE